METQNKRYMRPKDISEITGLPKSTVYKYIHDGTIKHIKIGERYIISTRSLEAVLKENTGESG